MKNEFETWLKTNAPAGQAWKGRLLPLAAAGTATALVGLSVVVMAGLGLPSGQSPMQAGAPAAAPVTPQTVRYAEALPTVTVVGRREVGEQAAQGTPAATAILPAKAASGDVAANIAIAGHNLRQ